MVSLVAAEWHELMISPCIMWLCVAHAKEQLDLWCSQQTYHHPISHTRPHLVFHKLLLICHPSEGVRVGGWVGLSTQYVNHLLEFVLLILLFKVCCSLISNLLSTAFAGTLHWVKSSCVSLFFSHLLFFLGSHVTQGPTNVYHPYSLYLPQLLTGICIPENQLSGFYCVRQHML